MRQVPCNTVIGQVYKFGMHMPYGYHRVWSFFSSIQVEEIFIGLPGIDNNFSIIKYSEMVSEALYHINLFLRVILIILLTFLAWWYQLQ